MATEIRPISIDIAFSDDGMSAKGAAVIEAVFVDGEFMRLLPMRRLAESTVEAVAEYATAFGASALAQVAALTAERNTLKAIADTVAELQTKVAVVTSERDLLTSENATLTAEVARLTALVPPPVADYMITPAVFVDRLELASPGVIDRLWASDTKEAGRLAVAMFTWSDRIDCRPGGRLEGYLNLIVQMGLMGSDSVAKVWV